MKGSHCHWLAIQHSIHFLAAPAQAHVDKLEVNPRRKMISRKKGLTFEGKLEELIR